MFPLCSWSANIATSSFAPSTHSCGIWAGYTVWAIKWDANDVDATTSGLTRRTRNTSANARKWMNMRFRCWTDENCGLYFKTHTIVKKSEQHVLIACGCFLLDIYSMLAQMQECDREICVSFVRTDDLADFLKVAFNIEIVFKTCYYFPVEMQKSDLYNR